MCFSKFLAGVSLQNNQKEERPPVSVHTNKFFNIVSLAIVLPVLGFCVWLEAASGMWKYDVVPVGIVITLFGGGAFVGCLLRGKLQPTKRLHNRLLIAAVNTLGDACVFVLGMAISGYHEPWTLAVLLPLLVVGMICTAGFIAVGIMKRLSR